MVKNSNEKKKLDQLILDVIGTVHAFIGAIKVLGEALGHVDDEDGVLVKVGQI